MSNGQQGPRGVVGSFADDEAALKRGKGGTLIALAVLGVAGVAGLIAFLGSGDESRVYGDLGRTINGLSQATFDQFWGCALPDANLKDIKSNTELMSQIDGRSAQGGARYGVHVRDACLEKLRDIEPKLDTLIVPADLKVDVEAMKQAATKTRSGWSALIAYLDNPELKYSSDDTRVFIENIARGWFEFKQAHAAANKTLKTKVSQ